MLLIGYSLEDFFGVLLFVCCLVCFVLCLGVVFFSCFMWVCCIVYFGFGFGFFLEKVFKEEDLERLGAGGI